MPEITLLLLGLLLVMFGLGFVLGWILRGGRIRREKAAINVSWQDQMSAKKVEHERLADQNKSLMEQVSQYQASKKDADRRAKELSASLKETFELRDELRRKLKQSRHNVDLAMAQRDKLKADLDTLAVQSEASTSALKDKDQKIFNLSRELESWQNRLPPLIERFRLRDLEAQEIEIELEKAQEQIASLRVDATAGETTIEPLETSPLANGMDASNDQYEETSEYEAFEEAPEDGNRDANTDEIPELASVGVELDGPADDFTDDGESASEPINDADAPLDSAANDDLDASASYLNGADPDLADLLEDSAVAELEAHEEPHEEPHDDLQQIKGVGPAIEKTLHDLGIHSFEQIASMSEYEIDRVARELRGFRSRIYREDWIGQAKLLQAEKSDHLA